MKKNKKWLAVVLAVVMALSSLSVAFTAFAASTKDEVEKAISEATAYDQKVVDLFSGYSEKSAIDKALVGKLIVLTAGEKAVRYGTSMFTNGAETLKVLGDTLQLTDDMKAGLELAFYIAGITPRDGKNFPTNYSIRWGTYQYTDYSGNMPAQNQSYTEAEATAAIMAAVEAYNALSDDAKEYITYISPNIFYNSFSTDGIIFNLTEKYIEYLQNKENISNEDLYSRLTTDIKLSPDMAGAAKKFVDILDAVTKYEAGQMTKEQFVAFAEENKELTAMQQQFSSKIQAIYLYNNMLVQPSTFLAKMNMVFEEITYNDFLTELKAAKLDASASEINKSVEVLSAAYTKLSDTYRRQFRTDPAVKELFDKFYQLRASYTGDKTLPNLHESFEKKIYSGSALMGNTVDSALAAVKDLLPTILSGLLGGQDLETFVNGLFTNYNVTFLAGTVYNAVGDLLFKGDEWTLDKFTSYFSSEYKDVAAAMLAKTPDIPGEYQCSVGDFTGTTYKEVENHIGENAFDGIHMDWGTGAMASVITIKDAQPGTRIYTSWADVMAALDTNPALYNWGVEEGNFESFADALVAALRPLTEAIAVVSLPNDVQSKNGELVTQYGLYETLILPLLEALNAEDVMSSAEFTALYEKTVSTTGYYDGILKPVLMQLYDKVVVPLLNDPIGYLLNTLPNLIYHLDDGCVTGSIQGLLDSLKTMGLDLGINIRDFKAIVDMVYGLIAHSGAVDENGNALDILSILKLPLTAEEQATADKIYNLMAGLVETGTPTVAKTSAATAESTIKVVADMDNAVNYLVPALMEFLGVDIDFAVKGEFVKSEAPAYPHNGKMGKDVMNTMIDGLDGLLSGLININDLINNGLCTNVMAADAITGIYGALGSIDLSALGLGAQLIPPSVVADAMNEDIYKDVAADLTIDSDNWADVVLVLRNDGKVIDCTDMGFEDGDRDGFINCLAAALRPIMSVAGAALVNGTLSDGSTNYGLYETIILPLFEDIGLTPAATSAEYTDNFNKLVKRTDPRGAYDYLLKTILAPVLDLVDSLAAAPAKTLFTVLPNLAYAIYYNPDIAFLGNLLDSMGGLTGILNGLLQGIETGKDANDEPIYGLKNFVLPEIPMNALASAGTVTEKDSKAALRETYKVVVADTADAFVTTFYYLYDAINYQDNMKIISDLIAGIDGLDPSIGTMVGSILNDVFTLSKEEALCALGSLLASDVWACPDGDGNNGDKTPSTGDYSVPAVAVLAVMFAAGAAVMVLRKKKVTE